MFGAANSFTVQKLTRFKQFAVALAYNGVNGAVSRHTVNKPLQILTVSGRIDDVGLLIDYVRYRLFARAALLFNSSV